MAFRVYRSVILVALIVLAGCSSVYYSVWESLGKEKRDLLRDRVESTRDQQVKTAAQFEDALEALRATYAIEPSKVQELYDDLKGKYKDAESEVVGLRTRISKMNSVAEDLFEEWEGEAESITNSRFRSESLQKLEATKDHYGEMRKRLLTSASRMDPVLAQFKDYVLFLKHNLNAQSLGSLEREAVSIESDIKQLIDQIQDSISDTDTFIDSLNNS
jgi:Protein of unknown function (DUF2959)